MQDIVEAVFTATDAVENGHPLKWKLKGGKDLEDEPLCVVVDFDFEPPRIVTIMGE